MGYIRLRDAQLNGCDLTNYPLMDFDFVVVCWLVASCGRLVSFVSPRIQPPITLALTLVVFEARAFCGARALNMRPVWPVLYLLLAFPTNAFDGQHTQELGRSFSARAHQQTVQGIGLVANGFNMNPGCSSRNIAPFMQRSASMRTVNCRRCEMFR